MRPLRSTVDESARVPFKFDEMERDGNDEPEIVAMSGETVFRLSFTIRH